MSATCSVHLNVSSIHSSMLDNSLSSNAIQVQHKEFLKYVIHHVSTHLSQEQQWPTRWCLKWLMKHHMCIYLNESKTSQIPWHHETIFYLDRHQPGSAASSPLIHWTGWSWMTYQISQNHENWSYTFEEPLILKATSPSSRINSPNHCSSRILSIASSSIEDASIHLISAILGLSRTHLKIVAKISTSLQHSSNLLEQKVSTAKNMGTFHWFSMNLRDLEFGMPQILTGAGRFLLKVAKKAISGIFKMMQSRMATISNSSASTQACRKLCRHKRKLCSWLLWFIGLRQTNGLWESWSSGKVCPSYCRQ